MRPRALAVGIPARNEQTLVPRCLAALNAAAALSPVPIVAVVVADACDDETVVRARRCLDAGPTQLTGIVTEIDAANVGLARHTACERAIEQTGRNAATVWLATTDADTAVPPDWFLRQLAWAALGADAVAGLVRIDGATPQPIRRRAELAQRVQGTKPGHGHLHVHGANLAVRAELWTRVGGFAHHEVGEDNALLRSLHLRHANLIGVPDMTVTTSGRRHGRTPGGFARFLAQIESNLSPAPNNTIRSARSPSER